jgi:MFS transporter, DHA1 family, multidrug resistance protein
MFLRRFQSSWAVPWQRTLYILFVAQLMTGVGFSSIFPFLPLYVKDLGSVTGTSTDLLAGLVFSGQAFTMMLTAPIWGSLADRFGRKLMVVRSLFGGVIVLLLMAFARSAEELVILRAVQGLITGTVAATNAMVAANAPREHAGYAMGFIQVGLGAGVALGPVIGGVIADGYGYAAAFYVTSVLLLIAGLIVLFWVKEPRETNPLVNGRAQAARRVGMLQAWRQIFHCPGVPAAYGLSFLNQLCRNMLLPIVPLFIPLLMVGTEMVNTFTGLVAGVASATTTLSSLYLGRLGDRIGQRRVLITSLVISSVIYAVQGFVTTGLQLLLLQAAVGVALGGVTPSIAALLARFTFPGAEGAVFGLDNSVGSGARSLAPLIGSSIMLWFGLRSTFFFTGGLLLLTALFALLALPRGKVVNSGPCSSS